VMVLGVIPCRVGKHAPLISSGFKVGLGWLVNAYYSHSIHGEGRGERF
jgi:hypothetical protein